MNTTLLAAQRDVFIARVDDLNSHELWGAYRALFEADAPCTCLHIVLERLIDTFGLDAVDEWTDTL